tara:strand:- start:356 stop:616 length:261 start_codon:yes stop_codon:yes gene_type:complete
MKVTKSTSRLEPKFTLELSESEANALVAMTVYGHKPFLQGFYTKLGRSYMQPHEKGVISLFSTIGSELPSHIDRIEKARKILKGKL